MSLIMANPSVQEVFSEGEAFRMMGDYYRAVESYKTALQMNPSYVGPLKGLAGSYFGLGEYQEALYWVEEAIRFDKNDLNMINLKGRILLGLGDFVHANDNFSMVLALEPYNIDAQFGLAELEIANGKMQNAAERYRNALRISPENRRALLSLVLLYDEIGNTAAAGEYIEQALYFYSDNAQVRFIAGSHYLALKDYDAAILHASAALTLDPDYLNAGILYSQLAIKNGNSQEAVNILTTFLSDNRDRPLLWYSLGIAYRNLEKTEEAIQAFAFASSLRTGDDMARITLENIIMETLELDDPRRERYASYHFVLGQEYDDRNLLKRAFEEFRRGLQIYPFSKEGRLLLGDIYRRNGLFSRYREELRIIDDMLEEKEVDISDELEFLDYRLEDSVSSEWDVEQFYIDRETIDLAVFYIESELYHQDSEVDLFKYIKNILSGYENINVLDLPVKIESFSNGYRLARESNSDYFIIIDIQETERVISLNNRIYMSETGGELKRWAVFRTGNQRIPDAAQKFARDIHGLMPVSGRLLDRRFDAGLISLGIADGFSVDDEFLVIRNGELNLSKEGFGFTYEESSVLGTFSVTKLDDLVCEGVLEKKYFFDMINQGDHIIPVSYREGIDSSDSVSSESSDEIEAGNEADKQADEPLPPDIYDSLLRIQ
ncbi:MAG: tetratricopeptide repeat protein [Spirochaetales bacterium]|nr:tetratricopeptide repeat protein [Spirochaetales bacterium]